MNEELFRKSSVEYVTSQEKLDAYIKVTNPGAWLTVTGIFLLLVCAVIFGGAVIVNCGSLIAGIGYLTEYYRDVRLEKWNVEVVISNDQGFAEGEEIEGSVVTKESKVLDFDLIREVRRRIEN